MPHFVEFHMSDLPGYVRFRQALPKSPNPPIHQSVIGVEDFSNHPEGTFGHGVKQDAKCFLGGNFFVRARVTHSKSTAAFFTPIALFASHNAVFNHLSRSTIFTRWHNFHLILQGGNLLSYIYILVNTLSFKTSGLHFEDPIDQLTLLDRRG